MKNMQTKTNSRNRPHFRAQFTWGIHGSILWLKDTGEDCRSLTNDMENSLVEISRYLPRDANLLDYHIIYQDSDGHWDGVAITNLGSINLDQKLLGGYSRAGKSYRVALQICFFPIQQPTYAEAVASIVSNRMYAHFKIPTPKNHNLN